MLLIILCLTGFSLPMLAQVQTENVSLDTTKTLSQYIYRHWTTEDGLPSNAILDLIQDKQGYIWIATHDGLARFDGDKFVSFTIRNTSAIRSHAIRSLFSDDDGTVWIGTQRGLIKYQDNTFSAPSALSVLSEYSIESIYRDKTGKMWIGTATNGVFYYQDEQVRPLKRIRMYLRGAVGAISESEGSVYFSSERGEMAKLTNGTLSPIIDVEQTRGILFTKTIGKDIWVGTGKGIRFLTNDSLKAPASRKVSEVRNVVDVFQDQYQALWFASEEGLYRLDTQNETLEQYDESKGLPSNVLQKSLVDKDGNVWLATFRGGLIQVVDGKFINYSESEGLCSNVIYSIVHFTEDKYLVGGESDSISILYDNVVRNARLPLQLPSQRIRHMTFDYDSSLWISTYNGLVKVTRNNDTKVYGIDEGLSDQYVRLTYQTSDSTVWVGTRRGGVFYQHAPDSFTNFAGNLGSEVVMSMAEDKEGNLLVGTKGGLSYIRKGKVIQQLWTQNGLASNVIFSIYVDEENIIWLGTDTGLSRVDNGQVTNYDANSGLCEGTAFDVLEDRQGYFWLPCNNGVMRIAKAELNLLAKGNTKQVNCRFFNRSDGMKSDQMVGTGKGLVDERGRVWLPTYKGVTKIDPQDIDYESSVSKVIFERLDVDNTTLYSLSESLTLPAGTQHLEIYFTAFEFRNPSSIDFKYRLTPFDKEWIYAQGRREANYTNLPPNKYRFEVVTRKKDGTWNEESPSVLEFEVESYLYQKWWFQVAAIVTFILLLVGFYYLRTIRLRRQQQRLETQVQIRTKEVLQQKSQLQTQKEELQNTVSRLNQTQTQLVQSEKMASLGQLTAGIAHEINNPINFVYAGVDALQTTLNELMEIVQLYEQIELEEDKQQIAFRLEQIRQKKEELEFEDLKQDLHQLVEDIRYGATRTSEIVKGLRTFSRLDEDKLRWANLHENIEATLTILRPQYKDRITLTKSFDEQVTQIECYPGRLNQVFTNIIANAIQAIPEKGEIKIHTKQISRSESIIPYDSVRIVISDNGSGMDEQTKLKIFEPFFTTKGVGQGTGLGLSISFGLIEKHNGKIEVESQTNEGTTFYIYLPIERTQTKSSRIQIVSNEAKS